MRTILLFLVLLAVASAGAIVAASEMGGEVVTLWTRDAAGREYDTPLWIVEDDGSQWLRAGSTDSAWYQRLEQHPTIVLERGGDKHRYEAIPMPHRTERINQRMAEEYGAADRLIAFFMDRDQAMAVRLDPIPFDEGF